MFFCWILYIFYYYYYYYTFSRVPCRLATLSKYLVAINTNTNNMKFKNVISNSRRQQQNNQSHAHIDIYEYNPKLQFILVPKKSISESSYSLPQYLHRVKMLFIPGSEPACIQTVLFSSLGYGDPKPGRGPLASFIGDLEVCKQAWPFRLTD